MSKLMISFDLKNGSPQNYDDIHQKIRSLGTWCNYWTTTYLLKTGYSRSQIYDILKPHFTKKDDTLIVVDFTLPISVKVNSVEQLEWI